MEARMKRSAAAVIGVTLLTAVVYAQKVVVDSDPKAPFAAYKTYAWVDGTAAPNPLNEQRLHAAIEAKLAQRGLTWGRSNPDLAVVTHVTTRERQELVVSGFGYGWWGGGGYGSAWTESYVDGTLVVDVYDARTKKMVWRGVASATASSKPTKNASKMQKAVDKMFAKFPVGAASPRTAED